MQPVFDKLLLKINKLCYIITLNIFIQTTTALPAMYYVTLLFSFKK